MTTDRTTKSISLSSLRRQKLRLEFDWGGTTPHVGALLLREADRGGKAILDIRRANGISDVTFYA